MSLQDVLSDPVAARAYTYLKAHPGQPFEPGDLYANSLRRYFSQRHGAYKANPSAIIATACDNLMVEKLVEKITTPRLAYVWNPATCLDEELPRRPWEKLSDNIGARTKAVRRLIRGGDTIEAVLNAIGRARWTGAEQRVTDLEEALNDVLDEQYPDGMPPEVQEYVARRLADPYATSSAWVSTEQYAELEERYKELQQELDEQRQLLPEPPKQIEDKTRQPVRWKKHNRR